jgi:isoaspartyl peptidase/L-asparaginase-like protein (Ntn-hydrolase superfamily)
MSGPYTPVKRLEDFDKIDVDSGVDDNSIGDDGDVKFGGAGNHDTIGMIAIDADGNVASGTSTNGATFKISG